MHDTEHREKDILKGFSWAVKEGRCWGGGVMGGVMVEEGWIGVGEAVEEVECLMKGNNLARIVVGVWSMVEVLVVVVEECWGWWSV